jgi:hypothetical protein
MRLPLLGLCFLTAACAPRPPGDGIFLPPYAEKGCWARFYEKADFGLPMRQLEGPTFVEAVPATTMQVPDLEEAGVQPLFVEARSLMTGPRAKLTGYSSTLFRGEPTAVEPGTLVRDAARLGYPERFRSMRLDCEA